MVTRYPYRLYNLKIHSFMEYYYNIYYIDIYYLHEGSILIISIRNLLVFADKRRHYDTTNNSVRPIACLKYINILLYKIL